MLSLLLICLHALVLGCTPPASEVTGRDLTIRAHSPTASYGEPGEFRVSVTFHNRGDSPLVILPEAIQREYTALGTGRARYTPFPGPRAAPWANAFLLAPAQSHVVDLVGHRDGDGTWLLEPGRYELVVRFNVTPELAHSAARHLAELAAPVWQGRLRAPPTRVSFLGKPAAQQGDAADRGPTRLTWLRHILGGLAPPPGALCSRQPSA